MPATIVTGAQWGDEGKGKIVDHLAERAAMVIRYQGGNNAGHTVVIGDTVLKLHQVPSGITRPQVAAVLGNGMVINPPALVEELEIVEGEGISTENLHISATAHMVMPYHLLLDELQEQARGSSALGTTKRGIGPAYTDKAARRGLRMQDMVDGGDQIARFSRDRFAARVGAVLPRVNDELDRLYGHQGFTVEEIVEAYAPAAQRLAAHIKDTGLLIDKALRQGQNVLLEGAQATMLDIDHGTYPFVTSSSPTAGGACVGAGIGPTQVREVVGVVKVYTSRVGSGPFPTELHDATGDWLVEQGQEYGTTTGRRRRCGWIDLVALNYAARVNGLTGLALTRLDVLSGLDEVKLCVAYRLPDGAVTEEYPFDTEIMGQVEAVYETMPGWQDHFHSARRWQDLPEMAQAYCQRISDKLDVPICMISVGAERNDLVALRWPI
jgi:adenylosuccinate synthase